MPAGAGKYDELCTYVIEQSQADLVLVAVVNGIRGTGFSVQGIDSRLLGALPDALRLMADKIEEDLKS